MGGLVSSSASQYQNKGSCRASDVISKDALQRYLTGKIDAKIPGRSCLVMSGSGRHMEFDALVLTIGPCGGQGMWGCLRRGTPCHYCSTCKRPHPALPDRYYKDWLAQRLLEMQAINDISQTVLLSELDRAA